MALASSSAQARKRSRTAGWRPTVAVIATWKVAVTDNGWPRVRSPRSLSNARACRETDPGRSAAHSASLQDKLQPGQVPVAARPKPRPVPLLPCTARVCYQQAAADLRCSPVERAFSPGAAKEHPFLLLHGQEVDPPRECAENGARVVIRSAPERVEGRKRSRLIALPRYPRSATTGCEPRASAAPLQPYVADRFPDVPAAGAAGQSATN